MTDRPPVTVVLAGNQQEFRDWCRINGKRPGRDAIYASSAAKVDGMRPCTVAYYGTWELHPHRVQIERVIARNQARRDHD